MTVLIAGGGIAGLTLALTCHEIGVPFKVFEATSSIQPLGVGINLQPNAVRELGDLGLTGELERIGVKTQELAFFSKKGLEIWSEPRGTWAGYAWPQFSVHRGQLQMLLYRTLTQRAGADCVQTGWRASSFANEDGQACLTLLQAGGGEERVERGAVLIGADGIHSAIRAQMQPDEGPPLWGGAIMWRGTTLAKPFRTGASMVMIGHDTQRLVAYPISAPKAESGLAVINWIAELRFDPHAGWHKEDWNRLADADDFLPEFSAWRYDWLDLPALISGAEQVFEYPMVDRDPLERWTHGRVTLMGDAAHATYPVGSNGGSQAIVDARKLGAAFLQHGLTPAALQAYESELRPITTQVILANRGSGPDAILQVVEDRCGGEFTDIEEVLPRSELEAHAAKYKGLAGLAIAALNRAPRTIT
ncbi:MAG: flavin-dependent oxidoreductase [Gammaproteobacteria bacterium]|nr:flavin-dependent oxidoreductase [Gammaproteobacteria bacterium]